MYPRWILFASRVHCGCFFNSYRFLFLCLTALWK
uniref:Uncharacterized protein n=1 Tax=Rhizophora mucronata TaxID=61149 RepID=A0A2P2JBC6_RHIMU